MVVTVRGEGIMSPIRGQDVHNCIEMHGVCAHKGWRQALCLKRKQQYRCWV